VPGWLVVHSGLHFTTFHKGNGGAGRRGGQEQEVEEEEGRSLKDFSSLSQEVTETWLPMTFTPHLLQYLCFFCLFVFYFALKFAPCLGMKLGVVFV
jgi:hypothetical protein